MSRIRELHEQAMDLAEQAAIALRNEAPDQARSLFRRAFDLEAEAAHLLRGRVKDEPTRSVLYRSAASLALDCGESREAEQLITAALSGEPPDAIADELRDLLERVYFERHLQLRGVSLAPEEVQLSIAGRSVGFGIAESDAFIGRVETFGKLVYRTGERRMNMPYRDRGDPPPIIKEALEVYVSVPRAASFAVSMKIGRPHGQRTLGLDPSDVIDDIVQGSELLDKNNEDEVKRRIPNVAYFRNFKALVRQLAPTGDDVTVVGLTVLRNGKEKRVTLTRRRDSISLAPEVPRSVTGPQRVEVRGKLLYADKIHDQASKIKVVDSAGKPHLIVVPEGMMSDIVRPLWEDEVIVIGTQNGDTISLEDITKARK
jgi:hypothetical protein